MSPSRRRTSFATAALTAALALWTSGAPSVVYPVYGHDWGIPAAGTTAVFAAYPIGLVVAFGLFGHLGDVLGRRTAISLGLALMAAGTLAFALAPGIGVLLAARVVTGIGVGFALSPATAGLAEYARPGRAQQAGSIATASTAFGLTVALVFGGAAVAVLPDPLHTPYWPLLAVLVITFLAALRLPVTAPGGPFRPRLLRVPAAQRALVARGGIGIAAAFATGAVVLALGADVAIGLVRTADPFVIGLVLATSSGTIGVAALLARRLPIRRMAPIGAVLMVAGLGALLLAATDGAVAALLASMVVSGVGYSFLFAAGVGTVANLAPEEHRSATLSAAYLIGYVVQAATAITLGAVATAAGLLTAIAVGVPVLAALAIAAGIVLGPRRVRTLPERAGA